MAEIRIRGKVEQGRDFVEFIYNAIITGNLEKVDGISNLITDKHDGVLQLGSIVLTNKWELLEKFGKEGDDPVHGYLGKGIAEYVSLYGIVGASGEDWNRRRGAVAHLYRADRFLNPPAIEKRAQAFEEELGKYQNGEVINLHQEISRTIIRALLRDTFSYPLGFSPSEVQELDDIVASTDFYFKQRAKQGSIGERFYKNVVGRLTGETKKYYEAEEYINEFFVRILRNNELLPESEQSEVLNALSSKYVEHLSSGGKKDVGLSWDEIQGIALDLITAGYITTATALSLQIAEIAHLPSNEREDFYKSLRGDLKNIARQGSEPVQYLASLIAAKDHTPSTLVFREVAKDTTVQYEEGGVQKQLVLKKGQTVLVHLPGAIKDAHKKQVPSKEIYSLPFHLGPRGCLGKSDAIATMLAYSMAMEKSGTRFEFSSFPEEKAVGSLRVPIGAGIEKVRVVKI